MLNTVLSITVLAAIALIIGAWTIWRRSGDIKRPLLMVILAAIAMLNVAIWTLPDASGNAPVEAIDRGAR